MGLSPFLQYRICTNGMLSYFEQKILWSYILSVIKSLTTYISGCRIFRESNIQRKQHCTHSYYSSFYERFINA